MKLFTKYNFVSFSQVTVLYMLQNMVSYLIIPNYNIIKADMHVSDLYLGALTGGFLLFNALAAIGWSFISDATGFKRKILLFSGFTGGGFFLLLSYLSSHPIIFLIFWIFAGGALGAIIPLGFSIISDVFKGGTRVRVFMLLYTLAGFGLGAGYLIALIAGTFYNWKLAILIGALALLFIGAPMSLLIYEPDRAKSDLEEVVAVIEGIEYRYRFKVEDIKLLALNKSNVYLTLQGIFGTIPNGVIFTWAIHYIIRDMGTSEIGASIFLGLMSTGALGGLLLSQLADYFYQKKPVLKTVLAGICSIAEASLFIIFFLINVKLNLYTDDFAEAFFEVINLVLKDHLALVAFMSFFVAMFFNASVGPIRNSVITEVNLPEHRATVLSGMNLMELISKSIGIAVVGFFSDVTGNLRYPAAFTMIFWYLSGFAWLMMVKYYNRDRKKTIETLRERVTVEKLLKKTSKNQEGENNR